MENDVDDSLLSAASLSGSQLKDMAAQLVQMGSTGDVSKKEFPTLTRLEIENL